MDDPFRIAKGKRINLHRGFLREFIRGRSRRLGREARRPRRAQMESAMIRSQTWPCPCPRLILRNGSRHCSPVRRDVVQTLRATLRARDRERESETAREENERKRRYEKRTQKRKKRSRRDGRSSKLARKHRYDCVNERIITRGSRRGANLRDGQRSCHALRTLETSFKLQPATHESLGRTRGEITQAFRYSRH